MKPSIQAIRLLAVEFARRVYRPVFITTVLATIGLITVSLVLTNFHDLWWVLFVIVIILSIIAAIGLALGWLLIKLASPSATKDQKRQARALVPALQRLSEVTATPAPLLFFRIMRDVTNPSADGFIGSLTTDSTAIKNDFLALKKSFES